MSKTGPVCRMCGHRTFDPADCRCSNCFAPVLCEREQVGVIKQRKAQVELIYQQAIFNRVVEMQKEFAAGDRLLT